MNTTIHTELVVPLKQKYVWMLFSPSAWRTLMFTQPIETPPVPEKHQVKSEDDIVGHHAVGTELF